MDTIYTILNQALREALQPQTAGVIIAVIGLNIHFGFTGLLNIGQAGFMLLGAYGFAISLFRYDLPIPLAILIGLGASIVFALILGAPTLKLRGDYLAIVTISAAEIVRFVGRLSQLRDFTGGALGIRGNRYYEPIEDLSFLPNGSFTLSPFNYRSTFDGSGVARGIGGLILLALVVGLVLLLVGLSRRNANSGVVADLSLVPVSLGLTVILVVMALAVSTRNDWTVVLALLAAVSAVALVFALRRAIASKPPSGMVVGVALATVGGLGAFAALFFVFPTTFPNNTQGAGWWPRVIAWAMVLVSTVIVALLARSPWGRMLRGVREDEDAMRSLGKNVYAVKMQALVIGGLFGALGGMVYVLPSTVQPDALGRTLTFFAFTALLLGGAATIFGPILGGIIFFSTRVVVREAGNAYIPNSIMDDAQSNQFSFIVVGVVLIALVVFRPQGVLGNKREVALNV